MALFVNTRTGQGIILEEYEPRDMGVMCEKFEGPSRPIEELLKEWIDNYLTMKWIADGSENIAIGGTRSTGYLKHKQLMQEYGWPSSFPLPEPQFHEFLRRKEELKEQLWKDYREETRLRKRWSKLSRNWYDIAKQDNPKVYADENFKVHDNKIAEALRYHEHQKWDRDYAKATGGVMQEDFRRRLQLQPSGNRGHNWSVDVTPASIMERFAEVLKSNPEPHDEVTEEIKTILNAAFQQYNLRQDPSYREELYTLTDDDSTSEWETDEEELTEEEEGEWDTDEDAEDLDGATLRADMEDDIEVIRAQLGEATEI